MKADRITLTLCRILVFYGYLDIFFLQNSLCNATIPTFHLTRKCTSLLNNCLQTIAIIVSSKSMWKSSCPTLCTPIEQIVLKGSKTSSLSLNILSKGKQQSVVAGGSRQKRTLVNPHTIVKSSYSYVYFTKSKKFDSSESFKNHFSL